MLAIRRSPHTASLRRPAVVAALLGSAGALGYGALKTVWALGGGLGVDGTPVWETDPPPALLRFAEFWGTVLLALLAVAILFALVQPRGRRLPQRPLRALAWTGAAMMIPLGLVGVASSIPDAVNAVPPAELEGMHPATFLFVYGSFLLLGLGFAATAWLTRAPRRSAR